ncbi:hypothetical protein K7X08_014927 [Anisodus acutangulus]|uniref:Uncharacterized protein n=1 Tax=Anisodus acutangulus TaxID=402998 RepID=A0A9Q1LJD1_9SOLA|nr:hypothetical protein K7X08_014927 [Anisodus acutangulus]
MVSFGSLSNNGDGGSSSAGGEAVVGRNGGLVVAVVDEDEGVRVVGVVAVEDMREGGSGVEVRSRFAIEVSSSCNQLWRFPVSGGGGGSD